MIMNDSLMNDCLTLKKVFVLDICYFCWVVVILLDWSVLSFGLGTIWVKPFLCARKNWFRCCELLLRELQGSQGQQVIADMHWLLSFGI